MPLPFRATAIYLLLGRYVLSFQIASAVLGRTKKDDEKLNYRPPTGAVFRPTVYHLSSSLNARHRQHHSTRRMARPSVLQGSKEDLGDHQMVWDNDATTRRRGRQILTWLPRQLGSFLHRGRRTIASVADRRWWWPRKSTPRSRICEYYSLLDDLGEGTPVVEQAPPQDDATSYNTISHGVAATNSTLPSSPFATGIDTLTQQKELDMMEPPEVSPTVTCSSTSSNSQPNRTATADASTDLTGRWRLLVTTDFKRQYDQYLALLGQPMLVRSVALSIIGMTTEETRQDEDGRQLWIKGTNPRGAWERVLTASTDHDRDDQKYFAIQTIDNETVLAEAWWENDGTMHNSWLRGVSKYGGGSFESVRYMESPDVLVCESAFHPNDQNREVARVTWRFARTSVSG
jgi:hypothetical protein